MPTRIIRDGILTSDRINMLTPLAELFYRRLMSVADDHGRFPANPTQLRAFCYPMRLDSVKESDIKKYLAECSKAGLLELYSVAGKDYLQVIDFGQRINGKSKFPEAPGISPGIPGDSRLDGGEGEGEDGGGDGKPDGPLPCPHQEIISLYHDLLPTCPRMKVWNDERESNLRSRWREDEKRQSLVYWRRLFTHIGKSEFLTGKATGEGRRPFFASLDWIVLPSNFAKIIEGKYHDAR